MKILIALVSMTYSSVSLSADNKTLEPSDVTAVHDQIAPYVVAKYRQEIGLKRIQAMILAGHTDSETLYNELRKITIKSPK